MAHASLLLNEGDEHRRERELRDANNDYRNDVQFLDRGNTEAGSDEAAILVGKRPELFPEDVVDWSIARNTNDTDLTLREWKKRGMRMFRSTFDEF